MTDPHSNPFILPGLGQSGEAAGNPLLASMEMMRKAWTGLMGPGGLAQVMPMAPPMNLEDLDRRIAELRTVESWLRLNLSMLGSTIQGLEVQRSTINTLRSFVDSVSSQTAAGAQWGDASPLEIALGLKPAGQRARPGADAAASGAAGAQAGGRGAGSGAAFAASAPAEADEDDPYDEPDESDDDMPEDARDAASGGVPGSAAGTADDRQDAAADKLAESGAAAESGVGAAPAFLGGAAQSASEAWWNLLQQQFGQLAAATAASMPGAAQGMGMMGATGAGGEVAAKTAASGSKPAAGKTAGSKTAKKTASKTTNNRTAMGTAAGAAGATGPAGSKTGGTKNGGARTGGTTAPAKPRSGSKAAAVNPAQARTSTKPAPAKAAREPSPTGKPSPAARAAAGKPYSRTVADGTPRNAVRVAGPRRSLS